MKNQKGFTLIELMVVIVIIGILSAVALPKMFSMSNKAKASEVQPAAATYERLQLTFVAENSETGDKTDIGFDDPQSLFFNFDITDNNTNALLEITVKKNLGKCTTTAGGTGSGWKSTVTDQSVITRENASDAECGSKLTSNFVGGFSSGT